MKLKNAVPKTVTSSELRYSVRIGDELPGIGQYSCAIHQLGDNWMIEGAMEAFTELPIFLRNASR